MAWGVVLIATLGLLNLPETVTSRVRLALASLFLPFFGILAAGQQAVEHAADAVLPRPALVRELTSLRRENQDLRFQAMQGAEALRENAHLRQLIGWSAQSGWKVKAGRVVARDPANWWRTVRIDLGQREGLRPDLPVVTPEGLVGRIGEVSGTMAEVLLVGDPRCRVAVLVRETGEHGVISAAALGVLDHRLVELTHLPRHTSLKPGQTVLTSGLGGVFPAGIPVGSVVDYRSVAYGLYTEARVKLTGDTSRLKEVLVLFP